MDDRIAGADFRAADAARGIEFSTNDSRCSVGWGGAVQRGAPILHALDIARDQVDFPGSTLLPGLGGAAW